MASFEWPSVAGGGSGSGTVTSVGLSVPSSSIFGVTGSPVTSSGTLGLTTAGTSGGIPYFSSTSQLSSSALLTASQLIVGGGAGTAPLTLAAGNQYQVLVMGSTVPGYGQVNLSESAAITGTLAVGNGGTGVTSLANFTDSSSSADGITVTGGTGAVVVSTSIAQAAASASQNGYLKSVDWSTFNGKQASGSYITALTGDGTASGPGSVALTLATVNSDVGSFGSSTSIPSLTVNAKGLVTAASGNVVIAPAGTLTGTTLNSTVVTSSLTSIGTIGTGTWAGTTIATSHGGTGVTSVTTAPAASAFAGWDANKNLSANSTIDGFATTATAGSTTVLTVGSAKIQYFTGTLAQTVTLPTTSIVAGQVFLIENRSTGAVTVQSSGSNTIQAMAANTQLTVTALVATPTSAANWDAVYQTLSLGLINPMTSVGDLITGTTSGAPSRLAIGTAGQILISSGTTAIWSNRVGLTYTSTTAGSYTALTFTIIKFPTVVSDPSSLYSTSTGLATVNAAGWWNINSSILTTSVAWLLADQLQLVIYQNGAEVFQSQTVVQVAGSFRMATAVNTNIFCANGDTLAIYMRPSETVGLDGIASHNFINLVYLG